MDKKTQATIFQFVIIFALLLGLFYFAYQIGRGDASKGQDEEGGLEDQQPVEPVTPQAPTAQPVASQEPQPVQVTYTYAQPAASNGHIAQPVGDGSPYRVGEQLAPLVPESLE